MTLSSNTSLNIFNLTVSSNCACFLFLSIQKFNNKYFFKYAARYKNVPALPNILLDGENNPVTDQKEIADLLQDQFKSVFSSPNNSTNNFSFMENISIQYPFPEFYITNNDVITAIDEIKTSSSCPNYDIPAVVFKKCKQTLSEPLKLFFIKSFASGLIPQAYKNQLIIPLFKKGLRTKPENYRPISLTAHTIKILERILRKKLLFYFEANNLFNSNQHGFRSNKSCSTQLLSHVHNIISNSLNGNDTDCVYVDFAKAFDKVDHKLLIQKLNFYQVPKNYLNWITNFLTDRIQTVSVNNQYSYSTPVLSGVGQGTVLAPFLFLVYINDLPTVINNCKTLTFADDTKIGLEISTANDTTRLQDDLNQIIKWSEKIA